MSHLLTRKSWKKLKSHVLSLKDKDLIDLFSEKDRVKNFSFVLEDIFFDLTKNYIDSKTILLLEDLSKELHLDDQIKALIDGKRINFTENKAVMHPYLRGTFSKSNFERNKNYISEIDKELKKIKNFSAQFRKGEIIGATNKPINQIVNIGIGGSNLAPEAVCKSLSFLQNKKIKIFFISNIDNYSNLKLLNKLNPEKVLFIVSSKSFNTPETLKNALLSKNWILQKLKNKAKEKEIISKHFVSISQDNIKPKKFGIPKKNQFYIKPEIGGRFSVWSSIGLIISVSIGYKNFLKMLDGAKKMDEHFLESPLKNNVPKLLGFIGIIYRNIFNFSTYGIFSYSNLLSKVPYHLQQLDMESNGKNISRNGKILNYKTAPILIAGNGTNCQHSFFQLLHQGTDTVPCDFILPILQSDNTENNELEINCLAQAQALMLGKKTNLSSKDLRKSSFDKKNHKLISEHKKIIGNKPSNMIIVNKITPSAIGALLALYEHKILVQGIIWNINSFDQWGVELGKELAKKIEEYNPKNNKNFDPSTVSLINRIKKIKE